jgi:hypothetical protein
MTDPDGTVAEPGRRLGMLAEADVVVVGGGPAGLAAAVTAARSGAEVLLVERGAALGGNMNLPGLPFLAVLDWSRRPVIAGILQEFVERLIPLGGATPHYPCPKHLSVTPLDPAMVRYVAIEMAEAAGVRLLLHTQVADALREGDRLRAVIVESKSGRAAIGGRVFIDATGDADLVARAAGGCEKGEAAAGGLQPMTLTFRLGNVEPDRLVDHLAGHPEDLNPIGRPAQRPFPVEHLRAYPRWTITGLAGLAAQAKAAGDFPPDLDYVNVCTLPRRGQIGINAARVFRVDGTDVRDLARAEVEGRRKALQLVGFFRRYVPGCEDSVLLDMAPWIGVRETRRILGRVTLTGEDVRAARIFPDAIAQGIYPIDIHSQDSSPSEFVLLDRPYTIPYRALLPRALENVIVAGRSISADRVALGSVRVMSHCMAVGQAAGLAAGLALGAADRPADIDVLELQARLADQGALTGAPGMR